MEVSNATEADDATGTAMFAVPFLSAVFVVGLIGNVFVLFVYTKKRYRRSNAVYYVLNLAIGDMVALLVVLFHITEFFDVTWPILWRADIQCQTHRYFRFVAFNLTVFTMVAIAVDRYFAVVQPLTFRLTFSVRRTKIICVGIWLLAFVAAVTPSLMFKSPFYKDSAKAPVVTFPGKLAWACKVISPFGPWWIEFNRIYINVVLCYVPTVVTAVIYVIIIAHIRRAHRPQLTTGSKSGTNRTRRPIRSWKAARTLLVVFVAYVVCYGSFATYTVLFSYLGKDVRIPAFVYNLCLLLPYVNSCMNPIIYSFMNPNFRTTCWSLLCHDRKVASRHDAFSDGVQLPAAADPRAVAGHADALENSDVFLSSQMVAGTQGGAYKVGGLTSESNCSL